MKKGISTKLVIVVHEHGIRLNRPHSTGIWRKLDQWLFNYHGERKDGTFGRTKGLPCFLPLPKIERQLVVDGKPIYSGGGVNCFNEPMKVWKVTVDKKTLNQCKEAYITHRFRIRNYEYNGFMGKLHDGYADFVGFEVKELNDGGTYEVLTSDNTVKYVPSWAIEGIQIMYKPKETKEIPVLFGFADTSFAY